MSNEGNAVLRQALNEAVRATSSPSKGTVCESHESIRIGVNVLLLCRQAELESQIETTAQTVVVAEAAARAVLAEAAKDARSVIRNAVGISKSKDALDWGKKTMTGFPARVVGVAIAICIIMWYQAHLNGKMLEKNATIATEVKNVKEFVASVVKSDKTATDLAVMRTANSNAKEILNKVEDVKQEMKP
jgi:hypothetical protein